MEKELYQTKLPFTVFEPDMLSGSLTLTAQEWGLESHFRQTCNMKYKTFHRKYKITKIPILRWNALLTPHQSNSSFGHLSWWPNLTLGKYQINVFPCFNAPGCSDSASKDGSRPPKMVTKSTDPGVLFLPPCWAVFLLLFLYFKWPWDLT